RILGKQFAALSLAQKQALRNIYDCPLDGKLGYLLIETSIIQVILIQLHALFSTDIAFQKPNVSRRDADIIQELKEYLAVTFLEDHSMASLSKHFGTNTNKLMSLFKKLFNKSIFEYLGELRMEHARQLLLDEAMLVTEVARTVGYKNPNHFSAAFKKRYGISPSEIK
ncbi:MAG TPA: AraC family transcriptional regulator, partial [Chryseosolibacter sp.]